MAKDKDAKIEPAGEKPQATPRRFSPARVALAVCAVLLLCVAAGGFWYLHSVEEQAERIESLSQPEEADPIEPPAAEEEELPENPVDFAALAEENPDVIAWVSIPNTKVNYPIFQSQIDDNFYFNHAQDGTENVYGALYTQQANAKDFSDPVTVVYGHRSHGTGVLFSTLHDFEDADFFNANNTFYIYTPGHILTYKIISAYLYDNRHILNSFDFSDPQVLQDYFNFVANPDSMAKNVREGIELTPESKIVQLSTCWADWQETQRYIVSGVLVSDQETS